MNLSFIKNNLNKIRNEIYDQLCINPNSKIIIRPKDYRKSITYEKTLNKLLEEKTGLIKVLSFSNITQTLNNIVKKNLEHPENTQQVVDDVKDFINLANNIKEYKTYIPIKGLDMNFPPFLKEYAFSPLVQVCCINEENVNKYIPTEKLIEEDISDLLPTIIEVKSFTADYDKSMELTVEVGKYIVNFFRYADFYGWALSNIAVRIPGYGGLKETMYAYTVSKDRGELLKYQSFSDVNSDYEFDLNEIRECGADKFGDLLDKYITYQLESMEKSLLRAIVWFGESKVDHDLGARFLKLTLAIESLLNTNDNGPITVTLRERTAFILSKQTNQRLTISNDINNLYSQRSAIVHRGKTDVSMKSLHLLESYAAQLIRAFLTNAEYSSIRTKDELQKKMEILKYN